MLEVYIREFIAVGRFLEGHGAALHRGFLLTDRGRLEKLLGRNAFDTTANKLRIWKNLKWIDTDKDHLTKKVYDGADKKYRRYVKMDMAVLDQMQRLSEPVPRA